MAKTGVVVINLAVTLNWFVNAEWSLTSSRKMLLKHSLKAKRGETAVIEIVAVASSG